MKTYRSFLYIVIFIFAAGVVSAADTPVTDQRGGLL